MTVHDSLVFMVLKENAEKYGKILKQMMEDSQRKFSPLAPPKADVDIRTSLADKDVIMKIE